LCKKFENLGNALRFAYPELDWDLTQFSMRGKKSGQRWLKVVIKQLLPGMEIVEDYQHPELLLGVLWFCLLKSNSLELDLWIPLHRIAIEYQGLFPS
jgi:hypothetical protein